VHTPDAPLGRSPLEEVLDARLGVFYHDSLGRPELALLHDEDVVVMRVFFYHNLVPDSVHSGRNLEQLLDQEVGPVAEERYLVDELDILLLDLERKLLQAFVIIFLPHDC